MSKLFPIEVMSTGVWNGHTFTPADLSEMANNFKKLTDIVKPPIKLGHTKDETGAPAFGWIKDLKVIGNKLVAYAVDIPDMLMKAIKKKAYRRVSSEVFLDFKYNGKNYGKVFSALALLGAETPAVKDLDDLQAYLTQNTDNGTFGKLLAFSAPSDFNYQDDGENNSMDNDKIQTKLEKITDQLATLTDQNATLKKENDALKSEREATKVEQFKAQKKTAKSALVLFCDEKVKAGTMLPAQRDLLCGDDAKVEFTEAGEVIISFDQFKAFSELGGKVLDKKQHSESGDKGGGSFANVQAEVDAKVKLYMAEQKEKDYQVALDYVLDTDADLAKRYVDDYAATERE